MIPIFLSFIVGCSLALPFLTLEKDFEEIPSCISIYVLQTGVYSSYENALSEKTDHSIIYMDNDLFRVIVGASMNESGLLKLENILKENNVHYYKKELQIMSSDVELFSKYNLMLEKANNKETVLLLNQKILEKIYENPVTKYGNL